MLEIALKHRPNACCLVPEKREELTTEGGLDVAGGHNHLASMSARLRDAGIRVSLFIDPDETQLRAASSIRRTSWNSIPAPIASAHLEADEKAVQSELARLQRAARRGGDWVWKCMPVTG